MKKKHLILLALLTVTLTILLSGCGNAAQNLDGMYIATFDLNQGKLDIMTSVVTTKINYAYEPGSLILDPTTYNNYEILRSGYRFTGWYTGAECKADQKWDFAKDKINQEALTLYAGWEKEIVYTFTLCYTDGDKEVQLGSYSVAAGEAFDDWMDFAKVRKGYTPSGYYSDKELTTEWDFETKHPGGKVDTDVRIYVDYIKGDWLLVDSYETLKNAIGNGNIYLMSDIDCGGEKLDFLRTFSNTFEGNGHKVTNFTVEQFGTAIMPSASVFQDLGAGAEIRNVTFDNVTLEFLEVKSVAKTLKVAALAREANGCTITNVQVNGKILVASDVELPRLNEALYEESLNEDGSNKNTVTGFTANITIEKKSETQA